MVAPPAAAMITPDDGSAAIRIEGRNVVPPVIWFYIGQTVSYDIASYNHAPAAVNATLTSPILKKNA